MTFDTYFSDTSVAASTPYTYVVTALDAAGNAAASDPLATTTPAASDNGDAPYCPSTLITSMTWNWSGGYTEANSSDLWSVTWGNDGNVYAFFGDGGGFGGDDHRGRTSFGISMIEGAPPPTSATASNIYGGYNSRHPSLLTGKASSIIAIGRDFYALAGIYRSTDSKAKYPTQPSGSPNHLEIAYSIGNAYSWRNSSWSFCSADAGGTKSLKGSFCPLGFVNFGRGNADAPDSYVYVFGMNPASYWSDGPRKAPLHTYLARVRNTRVLGQSAYRYFAGLDSSGNPIWSSNARRMQPVFSDRNMSQSGCGGVCVMVSALGEAVYNTGLKRYIGVAQGDYLAQTSFYDAPNVWGPWTVISYNNIHAGTGSGGWANLGTAAGVSLGVHAVNAWTSSSGQTMWVTYSSDGKAPAGALFPPAATAMDSFNLVRVDLSLATAR